MKFLIVIDMQNDFISGSLANEQANVAADKISAYINSFRGKIIFTRDTHAKNYLETQEGKNLPIKHCIDGTWGHSIDKRLIEAVKDNYTVIDKFTFGTDPQDWKRVISGYNEKDMEIEICGTLVDICVVSNALILKALYPEAKIKLLSSMVGYRDIKDLESVKRILNACQIEIIE